MAICKEVVLANINKFLGTDFSFCVAWESTFSLAAAACLLLSVSHSSSDDGSPPNTPKRQTQDFHDPGITDELGKWAGIWLQLVNVGHKVSIADMREVVTAGVWLIFNGDNTDRFVGNVWVVFLEPFDDLTELGPMVLTDGIWHPLVFGGEDGDLVYCSEISTWDNGSAVISVSFMGKDPPPLHRHPLRFAWCDDINLMGLKIGVHKEDQFVLQQEQQESGQNIMFSGNGQEVMGITWFC